MTLITPLIVVPILGFFVGGLNWMTGSVLLLSAGGMLTILAIIPDMKIIRSFKIGKG
jgi:hypothetical protein